MLDAFLDWLAARPAALQYLILAALSALENVFPPVPADVAVALGALLAQRGEVSAVLLGVVCWLANTSTAVGMYYAGRVYGHDLLRLRWAQALMPPEALAALKEAYDTHGVFGVFVSRFLPGLRAAVTPFAGVVGMPPLKALLPAAIASGIWYAFLVFAGAALGLNWNAVKRLIEDANRYLGLLAVVATVAFGVWLYRRVRRGRTTPSS